jgi:ATP phosphoribosyltransferase regulatory subunit
MRTEGRVPPDVLAAIRAPFLEAGGVPLDAPLLQPLGLLLDLAGESLRERLFVVQGDGDAEACLRPDFTIPAVRAHIDAGSPQGRYFYEGHAFRVSTPGACRAEEFLQIGLEAFEVGDACHADAEMAALAWRAACAGGRLDLTLLLGDVGLFAAFVQAIGVAEPVAARLKRAFSSPRKLHAELEAAAEGHERAPHREQQLAELLAGLSESQAADVLQEIWALAAITPVGGREPTEIVHRLAQRAALTKGPRLTGDQAGLIAGFMAIDAAPEDAFDAVAGLAGSQAILAEALAAWRRRLEILHSLGVPSAAVRFSPGLGRAFGYYDGMLFEVQSAALDEGQPVAAGGRYDGLPGRLGAKAASSAVGCMVRPGRAWKDGLP